MTVHTCEGQCDPGSNLHSLLVAEMSAQHPQCRDQDSLRLLLPDRPSAPALADRPLADTPLAEQEGVTDAYVCRLLPLTCLAPDIVEAILDGRQPKGLRLAEMLGNGPGSWEDQRWAFGFRQSV
jgi:hypothetical protein